MSKIFSSKLKTLLIIIGIVVAPADCRDVLLSDGDRCS